MKWGVRRYQNPDGSLTAAGKKRYQNPDGTLNEKGKKRLDNKSYENSQKKESEEFEKFVKDLNSPRSKMEIAEHDGKFDKDFLDKVKGEDWVSEDKREASINQKMLSEYKKYLDDPEKYSEGREADKNPTVENQNLLGSSDGERSRDAATLGLKALKKMGRDPGEIDDDNREWFLYEDQTVGLPMVADLVSQGKSKQTIKNLVEYVDKATDKDSSKIYDHGYFELSDLVYANKTGDLDKYIDACQEVVKDKNWKN